MTPSRETTPIALRRCRLLFDFARATRTMESPTDNQTMAQTRPSPWRSDSWERIASVSWGSPPVLEKTSFWPVVGRSKSSDRPAVGVPASTRPAVGIGSGFGRLLPLFFASWPSVLESSEGSPTEGANACWLSASSANDWLFSPSRFKFFWLFNPSVSGVVSLRRSRAC